MKKGLKAIFGIGISLFATIAITGCSCSKINLDIPTFLSRISISHNPDKMIYEVGETLSYAGMEVVATYTDKSQKVIEEYQTSLEEGYVFTLADVGIKKVTISYENVSTSLSLTINEPEVIVPTLSSIEVTHLPTKTTYYVNETFDPAGLVVVAHYSDESQKTLNSNEYTLSAVDMSTSGMKTITVTYEELTTTFLIEVLDEEVVVYLESIEVNNLPDKVVYEIGEEIDLTGLEVIAHYSDGSSSIITGYTISSINTSTSGVKEVIITYQNKTTSFNITVNEKQMMKESRYVIDFANSIITSEEAITPVGAKYLEIANPSQENNKVRFKLHGDYHKNDASRLIVLDKDETLTMVYDDNHALANIDSITVMSNTRHQYHLYLGYVGVGHSNGNEEIPNFVTGLSYHTGKSPRRLGEAPSYFAISNPSSNSLEITNIIITFKGGEHASNPFNNGDKYQAQSLKVAYDVTHSYQIINVDDASYWTTPLLGADEDKVSYRLDIAIQHNWNDEVAPEDPLYWEFDYGVDFLLPESLKDHIKITSAYINYPSGSFLSLDSSRHVSVSELMLMEDVNNSGASINNYLIRIKALNAITSIDRALSLTINFVFDATGLSQNEKEGLSAQNFTISDYYKDASEERPLLTGEDILEAYKNAYYLNHDLTSTSEKWVRYNYLATAHKPVIHYQGSEITSEDALIEGNVYDIIYEEGASTYQAVAH